MRSDGEYRIGNERQSVLDERPRNYQCPLVLSPSEQRRQHSAPEGGRQAAGPANESMRVSTRGDVCTAGLPPLDHSTHTYEILNPKDCCTSESQVLLYDLRYVRYEGLLLEAPRLVALVLGDPHLLEGGERRADGTVDPPIHTVLAHVLLDARSAIREVIGPSSS